MKKYQDTSDALVTIIKDVLKGFAPGISLEILELEPPKDFNFGDLSTNIALKTSRLVKQSPLKVADKIVRELKERLEKLGLEEDIRDIKNQNGFINFFFTNNYYYKQLKEILLLKNKFGKKNFGKNKKVLIEFVSANPTGPLSIAHARQAVIGDVLANLLSFLGYRVKREYYLNDEGNQVNILRQSIRLRLEELSGKKIEFPADHYQGEYIYTIAKEIKNKKLKIKNFSQYGIIIY